MDAGTYDIYFGSGANGATIALSCNYIAESRVLSHNVTVAAESQNVYDELDGYGEFSNALAINYYNADFSEVSDAESHNAGAMVYIGITWALPIPVGSVGFFLTNCSVMVQDADNTVSYGNSSGALLQAVPIIQNTCFAKLVSAAPVGSSVASQMLMFQYRSFLYASQGDQTQYLDCKVRFCMLDECANQVAADDGDCPNHELQFTVNGY